MGTIMHLCQASVDYDLNAQNLPEDDYDLFESNYPLQEQKRSGLFSGWYKRGGHKRWPICTSYSKSCNISPRSCCKGFVLVVPAVVNRIWQKCQCWKYLDLFVCVTFGGKTADARDKVFSHNGLVNLLSTSTMNIS